MKTIVILGAGQMGRNAELLLNQREYTLLAFGDNAAEKRQAIKEYRILPVSEALALRPDLVLIGVAAKERGAELERQARDLGYDGDIFRLDALAEAIDIRGATARRIAERIEEHQIDGAIAELGVYRGDFAGLLNGLFPGRKLYLFDTFRGFDIRDMEAEKNHGFSGVAKEEFADTSVAVVMAKMPHQDRVIVKKGFFPQTGAGIAEKFAFLSLDADLYAPTLAGLEWFWPRLSRGGVILLHDYNNARFPGVKQAVIDFERDYGRLSLAPLCDMHGSAVITRI